MVDIIRHLLKEDIQMTKTHMKKFSASLVIREIEIKITMRFYPTLVRLNVIKRQKRAWHDRLAAKDLTFCMQQNPI